MMFTKLNNIAILNIQCADYCCIFNRINKSGAINIMLISIWLKQDEHYKTYKLISKKNLTFGDIEIEKHIFYRYESPSFLKDAYINKVLVSNNISSAEKNNKYVIDYLYDDYEVRPLHIMLPKTSAYVKGYDSQTKWMYF